MKHHFRQERTEAEGAKSRKIWSHGLQSSEDRCIDLALGVQENYL